jgi:hypothetical protein
MRLAHWLAVPVAFTLVWVSCSSTTQNEGGAGGTGGAGGAAGAAGDSGDASVLGCADSCEKQFGTTASTQFRNQLAICQCADASGCEVKCSVLCKGGSPTGTCVLCGDSTSCLNTLCVGDCGKYRTCVVDCVATLSSG